MIVSPGFDTVAAELESFLFSVDFLTSMSVTGFEMNVFDMLYLTAVLKNLLFFSRSDIFLGIIGLSIKTILCTMFLSPEEDSTCM